MFRKLTLYTVALAGLIALAGQAPAQEATSKAPDSATDATEPKPQPFRLNLHKYTSTTLPSEASKAIVGNGKIVSVVPESVTVFNLFGKLPGQTNITFVDKNGEEVIELAVSVDLDVSGLSQRLVSLYPNTKITADSMGANVILTGSAQSQKEADAAVSLAEVAALEGGKNSKVINLMTVAGK